MPGTDNAAIQPALKAVYQERAERITYPKRVLLAQLRKETDFGGEDFRYAVRYEHGGGRSANFTKALNNVTGVKLVRFTAVRANEYYMGEIGGEALEASEETKWSQASALEEEFDSGAENGAEAINQALYRDGTGVIGSVGVGTTLASTIVKLGERFDARNFFVGQKLQAANPTGPALRVGGAGVVEIAKIDPMEGTLTLTGNLNAGITDVVVGDLLLNDGDFNAKLQGLASLCPAVVSGADSFRGVNRSVHRVRLAGLYINGSGGNKEEVMENVIAEAQVWGSDVDRGFVHPDDMREFKIQAGNRVVYDRAQASAFNMPQISFKGISVLFGSREVKIFEDGDAIKGEGFFLNTKTTYLKTLGKAPKFLNHDRLSKEILRATDRDSYLYRMGMRGNLICTRPVDLIRVKW